MDAPAVTNKKTLTANDFEFGRFLGKGSFANVYHARKLNGKDKDTIVAMKVVLKKKIIGNQKRINNIAIERRMLAYFKHPFIIKMYYAFETSVAFFFGLEYMPNGDLLHYLHSDNKSYTILDEYLSRVYVAEIILALQYLHENHIIFRDLKLENILIDENSHLKLSDFGLAKRLLARDEQTRTFCGTTNYMAPEILQKQPYTRAVDWWGVGILLFDILTGSPPFKVPEDRNATMKKITSGEFSFENAPTKISSEAQDLIRKLLKVNPTERLGAGETDAKELMNHVFFQNFKFDDLLTGKFEILIMRKRGRAFKKVLRKSKPFADESNDEPPILEDFNYISPSLLEPEELDVTG